MEQETDFSKEHIEKAVAREIAQHSLTLYPAAAGILALLWGGLFTVPLAIGVGVLSLATSVGFFCLQKFGRFGKLTTAYVNRLRGQQKEKLVQKLGTLAPELERLGCHQGAAQVELLKSKFAGLDEVIQQRLAGDDSRASRIRAIADQLYLATIDNLQHAGQILKSVENIDLSYIEEQIARAHSPQEKESLEERKRLKLEGIDAAEEAIANNELAMTKVSQLAVELAKTRAQDNPYDMEASLHEITNSVRVEQWTAQ